MESSSSSPFRSWKYDVFLSFRGEDTRKTFVDHLYDALERQTIRTYKDDVTLARGDTIGPSLLKAISESQILVIIFSENYADSLWCLDELSHIMKCKDSETGQLVIPIFYHVDPSDVRKQKRKYGEAFARHELSGNNKKKIESWKKTLVDASNIAGWETKHVANEHEATFIQEIVGDILKELSSLDSAVEDENLVGMGTRLQQLRSHLRIGSGGVRMIGIWGVGGIGKTTLANSLYKELKMSRQFHGCCFVENIREASKQHDGLKILQEKILSTIFEKQMQVESVELGKDKIKQMLNPRKVLIVLDDVNHVDQLNALAGSHKWFGDGSRIIITTRDKKVLSTSRVRVDEVCPVSLLSHDEAIWLFKRHAYDVDNPVQDYEELSLRVISYVNGLPLALKILGGFLYGEDKNGWMSSLDKLKHIPNSEVTSQLKISYDGLDHEEKELFLDIACFYRGTKKDDAMNILDACGLYPHVGVKVLIQKALLTVSLNGYFDMHDLVQEMGHYIVRGDHRYNPEKHSRVWRKEDIEDMCSRNATMENEKIEAIQLYAHDWFSLLSSFTFRDAGGLLSDFLFRDAEAGGFPSNFNMLVSNMKKLRLLKVDITAYEWLSPSSLSNELRFNEGPSFLSNELRYLSWSQYPTCCPFPETFQPPKLAVLKMKYSLQKELWKGYKYLPSLKELELVGASKLERTPNFGGLPCLEKLTLEKCDRLKEIHQSLGNHSSLVYVCVKDCKNLTRFPSIVRMEKLETLKISGCIGLVRAPDFGGVPCLKKLIIKECESLKEIHQSLGTHNSLVCVHVWKCNKLTRFPGIIRMEKLEILNIQFCRELVEFPKIEANMDSLVKLSLMNVGIEILPSTIGEYCTNLISLNLADCGLKDGDMPNEIDGLLNLQELILSGNYFTRLDFSLSRLASLKALVLSNCKNLVELPKLPSSIADLEANWCSSLNTIIRDDIHINCKRLCRVSIVSHGRKNIMGGERLLETMLQGNSVESGCISFHVAGFQILLRGFEPRLFRGERCRMELPENWYNDFSGFLFFTASTSSYGSVSSISMKHEKLEDDVYLEKSDDCRSVLHDWLEYENKNTWMGYVSFGLLRNTLWWQDHTSSTAAIQIEFHNVTICGCGCKLIPRRSETTSITDSPFDDVSNDYNCKLRDLCDSKSTLRYSIRPYNWPL